MAAQPPDGAVHPGGLHLGDQPAHHVVLRADEDARHRARTGPRVDHRVEGPGRLAAPHRIQQELRPRRDFHHGARGRRHRGASQPPRRHRPVPRKPRQILTAPQFDAVYAALPDSDAQLLVETAIETGLRWGELTELRAADIDVATGVLTVSRAVIAVSRKHHPAGRRFWVKNYPKDREYRQLRMSDQIVLKLSEHVTA